MQNATSTHRHDDTGPIPYTLTDKAHDTLEGRPADPRWRVRHGTVVDTDLELTTDGIYSTTEAGQFLGCSTLEVRELIHGGELAGWIEAGKFLTSGAAIIERLIGGVR